jgi:hypothetical protein
MTDAARFTLIDGRIVAHGSTGERDLSPDEVEALRDALPAPRLPTSWELLAVILGMLALAYWAWRIKGGVF